jgi:hypothetical protein
LDLFWSLVFGFWCSIPTEFAKLRPMISRMGICFLVFRQLRLHAVALAIALICLFSHTSSPAAEPSNGPQFPRSLESYGDSAGTPLMQELANRIHAEPLNLIASLIFALAITHTLLAAKFMRWSERLKAAHQKKLTDETEPGEQPSSSNHGYFWPEVLHFLGEVEAIFGIWVIPLLLIITFDKGWATARDYLGHELNFTEPLFVVVIMAMAASRPILRFSEQVMSLGAALGKGSPAAWWLSILTIGPILGSFITEPAAMTISALLLAKQVYSLKPATILAYATLGLLFVNISVGGTLTHFAAPPVLMVASKWGWNMSFMFVHFGWKALLGIAAANSVYFVCFRRQLQKLVPDRDAIRGIRSPEPIEAPIPPWITLVHILFLAWTVMNSHFPALFIGGFLFYLAFTQTTEPHQEDLALKPALLVGFFLAGLVVHGGLQSWWIAPVLSRLAEVPLFVGACVLTAFNDNAAITYLASLVPSFGDEIKYAVVAGAVVGGGLTVIANAPNPAGQSILGKYFPGGIAAGGLLLGALIPTAIFAAVFLFFR